MNVKDVYATLGSETYKSSQMKMINKTTVDSVEFWFNRRDFFSLRRAGHRPCRNMENLSYGSAKISLAFYFS